MNISARTLLAFSLPFMMIIPPVLERVRGLHAPELTFNIVVLAVLFALPFALILAALNRGPGTQTARARFWSSGVMALCVFMFLDIAFGGVTLATQYLPVLDDLSLGARVGAHFALILVIVCILGALIWKMYKDALNILFILFGIVFLTSLFTTEHKPFDNWVKQDASGNGTHAAAPAEVYIILDAMIGLGGIDRSLPGGQSFYDDVMAFHEKHGLAVYENAFSRQGSTVASLPPALNFDFRGTSPDAYIVDYNGAGSVVVNPMFEAIAGNGKGLTVYQTPYLNFCQVNSVTSCNTLGIFNPFNGYTPPEITGNAAFVTLVGLKRISLESLSMTYIRLFLKNAFPRELARDLFGIGDVPEVGTYNALSFERWFSRFADDLMASGGRTNYFAHFIVPHDPFVLDAECRSKSEASGGMFLTQVEGVHGDALEARRAAVYREYFSQARCVYKTLDILFSRLAGEPAFEDVRVVLFGDHGPRISAGKFARYLGERDLKDNYSVLFSFWEQGGAFEVIEKQASLQQLLSKREEGFRFDPSEEIVNTVVAPQQKPGEARKNVEIAMPVN